MSDDNQLPPSQISKSLTKLMDWESMALSTLIAVLVKFYDCDYFDLRVISRPDVATRIWFTLSFELPERYGHESKRRRLLAASSLELTKERLIKCLDRDQLCETRLKIKAEIKADQQLTTENAAPR